MTGRRPQHHTTSALVTQTLDVYERDASLFLTRWGWKRYKRPALLGKWLTLLRNRASLADLGCGAGQDARYLTAAGHRVIGLDRARPLLRFSQSLRPSVPLLLADMRQLPFRGGSFDGMWAAASLVHVPKTETAAVLRELRRCLKPGGVLAATLTYGSNSRIREGGWMPGRYFARWRKVELQRLLRRAGWTIVLLTVVSNQERKGRWINVIVRREAEPDAP